MNASLEKLAQAPTQGKPPLQAVCIYSGIHWQQIAGAVWPQVPPGLVYAVVAAGAEVQEDVALAVLCTINQLSGQAIKLDQISGWI